MTWHCPDEQCACDKSRQHPRLPRVLVLPPCLSRRHSTLDTRHSSGGRNGTGCPPVLLVATAWPRQMARDYTVSATPVTARERGSDLICDEASRCDECLSSGRPSLGSTTRPHPAGWRPLNRLARARQPTGDERHPASFPRWPPPPAHGGPLQHEVAVQAVSQSALPLPPH